MQNAVEVQEIDDNDPPAFRYCGASHAPFFQKCTSPLLSTAAHNVVDGQDTTLRDERSRASIACALDHDPDFGAADAVPPSVATHTTEHRSAIATTRLQRLVNMTAR
jgi:hypothetical protein